MQKDLINYEFELSQQREKYISAIKHNLKIPTLAQIRALELLLEGKIGFLNVEQKEIINLTLNSCNSMYDMMSDILSSYDLQSKNIKLNKEKVDIIKLIKEILILKNTEYHSKNINVRVNSEEKVFQILSDKILIQKALSNIIGHVFSKASKNSRIICQIDILKKILNISISYESLTCENNNFTKIGANIKLDLANEIIRAHKGQIDVENNLPYVNYNIILKL